MMMLSKRRWEVHRLRAQSGKLGLFEFIRLFFLSILDVGFYLLLANGW